MAKTTSTPTLERVDERPRRGVRLIDKVRSLSGEFEFTALLSGVKGRRRSEPLEEFAETPVAAPDGVAAPAVKPGVILAPVVLEEHAAELRSIWNPAVPDQEPEVNPPAAPWEVQVPARSNAARVRVIRSVRRRERRDMRLYLRGALTRAVLCLAVMAVGFAAGAVGTAAIHQIRPVPVHAKSKPGTAASPRTPTTATRQGRSQPDAGPIRLPLTLLAVLSFGWVLGVPFSLGSLQKGAFAGLALGVLLTSSWAGSAVAFHALSSRPRAPAHKAAGPPRLRPAATNPSASANKRAPRTPRASHR
jgi:hypothetical protein